MKKAIRVMLAFVTMLGLAGCATYPTTIDQATKQTTKSVCVLSEVGMPGLIHLGYGGPTAAEAGGVPGQITISGISVAAGPKTVYGTILSTKLLGSFKTKLQAKSVFTLKPDNSTAADAAFVLDLKAADLVAAPIGPVGTRMRPVVTVVVTLVANPPFKIVQDRSGLFSTTDDPAKHKVLFQKESQVGLPMFSSVEGVSYRNQKDYRALDVFEETFTKSIDAALDNIMAGW